MTLRWEKGNPAFDSIAGSSVTNYAVKAFNFVFKAAVIGFSEGLVEAGVGHLPVLKGHTATEIMDAFKKHKESVYADNRSTMHAIGSFDKENLATVKDTDAPGLMAATSGANRNFLYNADADKPEVPVVLQLGSNQTNNLKGPK